MNPDEKHSCSYEGCSADWDVMCVHASWCWEHSRKHRATDGACDKSISEAMTIWMVRGAMPFINAWEHFRASLEIRQLPASHIEEQLAPVSLAHFDLFKEMLAGIEVLTEFEEFKTWLKLLDSTAAKLKGQIDESITEIRNRFEGDEMPFNLDDAEVWAWYRAHLDEQTPEH